MKKKVRIFTALALAIMMFFTVTESALAEISYPWTAVKTPGMTAYGQTTVDMPLFKGEMSFRLTYLYGDCSYLLAKAESSNSNYYYVNTTTRSVMLTRVNGEQTFYMGFTTLGNQQENMIFKVYVEHNANVEKYVEASGVISCIR